MSAGARFRAAPKAERPRQIVGTINACTAMLAERAGFTADLFAASVYRFMRFPAHAFTPIFVCSRITGRAAPMMERRADNKRIRLAARYIGPLLQQWKAIEDLR